MYSTSKTCFRCISTRSLGLACFVFENAISFCFWELRVIPAQQMFQSEKAKLKIKQILNKEISFFYVTLINVTKQDKTTAMEYKNTSNFNS